ncbi:MAG: hypothetical protein AABW47_00095 [Nanoarchaeota archaeon]
MKNINELIMIGTVVLGGAITIGGLFSNNLPLFNVGMGVYFGSGLPLVKYIANQTDEQSTYERLAYEMRLRGN